MNKLNNNILPQLNVQKQINLPKIIKHKDINKLNKFSNHNYYYNHVYQNPIHKPNNNAHLYHDNIKQFKNKYNIDRFIDQNNNKNLNNYPQFNAQYYKNKYSKNYNIINGRHLPPIL